MFTATLDYEELSDPETTSAKTGALNRVTAPQTFGEPSKGPDVTGLSNKYRLGLLYCNLWRDYSLRGNRRE